eukprot:gene2039-4238_t
MRKQEDAPAGTGADVFDVIVVYRGLGNLPMSVIASHLRLPTSGSKWGWGPPQSFSTDIEKAYQFADPPPAIVFKAQRMPAGTTDNGKQEKNTETDIIGCPLWHVSEFPDEKEILTAPFMTLKERGLEFAEGRLFVTTVFVSCALFDAKREAFLSWVRQRRDDADARLAAASPDAALAAGLEAEAEVIPVADGVTCPPASASGHVTLEAEVEAEAEVTPVAGGVTCPPPSASGRVTRPTSTLPTRDAMEEEVISAKAFVMSLPVSAPGH